MTIREKWLILPLCGVLTATASVLSGCEDAAARERTQIQTKLDGAIEEFRRAEFSRVITELTPVTGGEPGQQAARGLLLADANRELALRQLVQAESLELEQRRKRNQVRANLAGLLRLSGGASALAAASTDQMRADLNAQRDAIDRQIRDLNRTIAEIDGPISERKARIEQDRREVERLRDEADEHYREALNLGHADGLKSFERATALRRQADHVEKRIALVELEVTQDLEPQRTAALLAVEHAKASQEGVQASLRELDEFSRIYSEQIAKLQASAEDLRRKINDGMQALAATSANEVEPLYEQAVSQLERAASEASRAAAQIRADAGAARLTEARCRETLGRAHWSRARGLSDHAALLASLVTAGQTAGNAEGHRAQFEAASAKQREVVELARTAYEAAVTAVEQAPGRIDGADAYRYTLQNAVDLLAGREVTPPAPEMPEIDFGIDLDEAQFDPAMLEGLVQMGGKEGLLAMLDQMVKESEEANRGLIESGMVDAELLEKGREAMNNAFADIRNRIERDEITTMEQLQQAMMKVAEEVMRIMGFGG